MCEKNFKNLAPTYTYIEHHVMVFVNFVHLACPITLAPIYQQ